MTLKGFNNNSEATSNLSERVNDIQINRNQKQEPYMNIYDISIFIP